MGRGRAKAKQTKVARDLKYRSVDTDFASLERELRGTSDEDRELPEQFEDDEQYGDLASRYGDVDDEDDDDEAYGR